MKVHICSCVHTLRIRKTTTEFDREEVSFLKQTFRQAIKWGKNTTHSNPFFCGPPFFRSCYNGINSKWLGFKSHSPFPYFLLLSHLDKKTRGDLFSASFSRFFHLPTSMLFLVHRY